MSLADSAATAAYVRAGHPPVRAITPLAEGVWRVESDGQESEARSASGQVADIRTDPRGLASLVSGHTSASELTRYGRMEVTDSKRLPQLDALFATRHRPTCMNDF